MHASTVLLISLIVLGATLIGVLIAKPGVTASGPGKLLGFVTLFLLPLLLIVMGFSSELERSKSTGFCLSCHVMQPHGLSLYVDDPDYLAASHFQNHRVPPDQACYTCHTNYAMFGSYRAKWHGLQHLYVQYLGKAKQPLQTYEPYNNRECLHCHLGARSFEEAASHTSESALLADIKTNKLSCMSSDCHATVHNTDSLKTVTMWKQSQ